MVYLLILVLWATVGTLCVHSINSRYSGAKHDWFMLPIYQKIIFILIIPVIMPLTDLVDVWFKK